MKKIDRFFPRTLLTFLCIIIHGSSCFRLAVVSDVVRNNHNKNRGTMQYDGTSLGILPSVPYFTRYNNHHHHDDFALSATTTSNIATKQSSSCDENLVTSTNDEDENDVPHPQQHDPFVRLDDTLTKALSKVQVLMDPKFIEKVSCIDNILKLFFTSCCNEGLVHIGKSTIDDAGRGLFASTDLLQGTIIGFYPVDAIGINFYDGGCFMVSSSNDDDENNDKDMQEESNAYNYEDSSYTLNMLGNRNILNLNVDDDINGFVFIDANPKAVFKNGWLCHMINDGSSIQANTQRAIIHYYIESIRKQNIAIIPFGPSPICVAVTTRNVIMGEELFTTYGYSYWLPLLCGTNPNGWSDKNEEIIDLEKSIAFRLIDATDFIREKYTKEEILLTQFFHNL